MIINEIFSPKLNDILLEFGMSDVASILDDIKSVDVAQADFDIDTATVYLSFSLYGQPCKMRLVSRPDNGRDALKTFRSRLYAAAVTMMKGRKPNNWGEVLVAVKGKIRPSAIKIFTNPKNFKLVGLKYDGFSF